MIGRQKQVDIERKGLQILTLIRNLGMLRRYESVREKGVMHPFFGF